MGMRVQQLSTSLLVVTAMAGLLTGSGCASRERSAETVATAPAEAVGPYVAVIANVTIKLDAALEADRVARFNDEKGDTVLHEAVEGVLSSAGRLTHQSGPTMELLVTGFRLRSTGAAFWVGAMAGNDSIEVKVTVREGDREIKSFQAYSSTILGGLIMPAADVRLRRICNGVAEDIAAKL